MTLTKGKGLGSAGLAGGAGLRGMRGLGSAGLRFAPLVTEDPTQAPDAVATIGATLPLFTASLMARTSTHALINALLPSFTANIDVGGLGVEASISATLPSFTATISAGLTIPAVVYDGVQGYLKHTGGPTGAADGQAFTVVWSGTFNSDGSAMTLLDIPGTVPVKLYRNSDNTIHFDGGTAGAVFANDTSAVTASLGFLIILASCNGNQSVVKVVHGAGTITGSNTAGSAANLDLTADWYFGADGGTTEFLDADTAMWWAHNAFIDFSDANKIEEFWDTTNDLLRQPGSDGSNPNAGTQPLVCHKNHAASHTVNVGSGGNADAAGTFEDGTSPGNYAEDFTPSGIVLEDFTAPVFESDATDRILTLTYPDGIEENDVVLAVLVSDWADGWVSSDGFTLLENNDSNPTHAVRLQVFGLVADGTETGTTTFTFNSSAVSVLGGAMLRISGVDVSGGIDGIKDATSVDNKSANSPDTSPIGSSITTSTNGAMVLYFEANDGSVNSGTGAPATAVYDADTTLGNDIGMALSYKIQDTAGASGTATFTLESAEDWVVTTVALKPAA